MLLPCPFFAAGCRFLRIFFSDTIHWRKRRLRRVYLYNKLFFFQTDSSSMIEGGSDDLAENELLENNQFFDAELRKHHKKYPTDIAWVVNWLDSGSAFFKHCQMYLFLANYFSFIAFSHLMLVVNSSTNMILYIFLNKLFRLHFINLVKSIVACVCGPCRRTVRVLKIMSKEKFWNSSNSTGEPVLVKTD